MLAAEVAHAPPRVLGEGAEIFFPLSSLLSTWALALRWLREGGEEAPGCEGFGHFPIYTTPEIAIISS